MLRFFSLAFALLFPVVSAAGPPAQLSDAAKAAASSAGQNFGNLVKPGQSFLPTKGVNGTITLHGKDGATSTITADKLVPSGGQSSKLGNSAGNDAGIGAATNSSVQDASTSQTPWGEAYRTLNGSIKYKNHVDLTNDPIWGKTDKTLGDTFSQNFSSCSQSTPPAPTSTWLEDIKHCIENSSLQTTCHITHTTGTTLVPAPKRCDQTTFTAINKTVYSTPKKTIKDNVTCSTAGSFVHTLTASTLIDTPHQCTVVDPVTDTCNITHSYSVSTVNSCTTGQNIASVRVGGIAGPGTYGAAGTMYFTALCGAVNGSTQVHIHASNWLGSCDGFKGYNNGHADVIIPPYPTGEIFAGNVYLIKWSGYFYCMNPAKVWYTSNGCVGDQCSASFKVADGATVKGCSDGSAIQHRWSWLRYRYFDYCNGNAKIVDVPTYKHVSLVWVRHNLTKKVTDNGWIGHPSTCSNLIVDIDSGAKTGSYSCGLDPAGGGQCVNLSGGQVCQSDMTSPYSGISSLCQRVDVSATTPRKDGCATYKNDPKCTATTPSCASGTCNYNYTCTSTTTTTSPPLTGCSSGGCSATL